LESSFDITKLTSFKIGGKIKEVYSPTTIDKFVEILKVNKDAKVLGNLSNVLISSDGYDGTVILTSKLNEFEINDSTVKADCGVKGAFLAQEVSKHSLSGFEFMIGFPGSIGGNIYMNASAHGQCISDNLMSVTCFDGQNIKEYKKEDLHFEYRHCEIADNGFAILGAEFKLIKSSIEEITAKMSENLNFRKCHQPSLAFPNCGSVFKNPENHSAGRLLDSVGAKNLSCGGVKVWENHANFIVNNSKGTSTDVLSLMDKMKDKVKNEYGIELIPEVKYLGNLNKKEEELCRKLKIKSV